MCGRYIIKTSNAAAIAKASQEAEERMQVVVIMDDFGCGDIPEILLAKSYYCPSDNDALTFPRGIDEKEVREQINDQDCV